MSRALAFLPDPVLAASVLPADGDSLDLEGSWPRRALCT